MSSFHAVVNAAAYLDKGAALICKVELITPFGEIWDMNSRVILYDGTIHD